jgi:TetR/AcrR family transcriptional regulator, transcriptional repressor for nem operon
MARLQHQASGETATRILDVAEKLVQRRGFNGFSYADIAGELKITTASLHYHFASKADLGKALINRYAERFLRALDGINSHFSDAAAKLRAYADLYGTVLREERLCLCGMLAAEYNTLPQGMREAVTRFFDDNETWLARLLAEGHEAGELHFPGSPEDAAHMIVAGLEGAMLVSRPSGGLTRFQSAANRLIGSFMPAKPSPSSFSPAASVMW